MTSTFFRISVFRHFQDFSKEETVRSRQGKLPCEHAIRLNKHRLKVVITKKTEKVRRWEGQLRVVYRWIQERFRKWSGACGDQNEKEVFIGT